METKFENSNCSGLKIIIEDKGMEIGRAYLYILYNDLHEEPFGFLEDVFVDVKLRGQGIGKKLISEVLSKVKEKKCYKLICTSRYAREKVHQFYKNFGFKDYGKEFRIDF